MRYCPPNIHLRIAGVDAVGNKQLGEWAEYDIGGRTVEFMPVARLDHSNLRKSRPHSAWVALGLRKYRPAPNSDIVNTHRLSLGAVAMHLYPSAGHVQYLHGSGVDDLKTGSVSLFRHALFAYRGLERRVIPRAVDTVVMAVLPEQYTLTVAGKGSLERLMRRLAQESPASDRITFVGAIPKSEIGAAMRDHHLLLMTSRFEGYPYAVVEGLASGLPVMTTPGGEPNGLVRTGINGARVDADSAELFVRAAEIASGVPAVSARESLCRMC